MDTIIACRFCGLAQRVGELRPALAAQCCRCGCTITKWKTNSLDRTGALSLAALMFYVPANLYPILRMEYYGAYSESTVWDGCVRLFEGGQSFVALVVFFASILIPLLKLLGLFLLVGTSKCKSTHRRRERAWVCRIIETIGPWAMLDVFLLAVLVALVKLEQLVTIMPGPGLLAFTAVVVLSVLASASFDPKLIWEEADKPS